MTKEVARGINESLDKKEETMMSFLTSKFDELTLKIESCQFQLQVLVRQTAADNADALRALRSQMESIASLNELEALLATKGSSCHSNIDEGRLLTVLRQAVAESLAAVATTPALDVTLRNSIIEAVQTSCFATQTGAISDRHTTEQLASMAQMLLDLKKDIRSVAGKLSTVRVELAEVSRQLRAHSGMLVTLAKSCSSVPTLPVFLPADFKSVGRTFRNVIQTKLRLHFLCPVTKKLAISGPKGVGYTVVVSREWLIKAVPVIRLGLTVAKIAAATYGIPLPIPMPSPPSPSDISIMDLIDNHISEIDQEITKLADEVIANAASIKALNEAVKSGGDISQPRFVEATGAAYEALYRLVKQLENGDTEVWSPRHTGLIKVVSQKDGATAWVSVGNGEELFHVNGIEALR
jgi:hypothetical protein